MFSPDDARAPAGGATELRIEVDTRGIPHDIKVMKSCGQAEMDARAVEAVKRYHFTPAQKDGAPVRVRLYLMVKFPGQ